MASLFREALNKLNSNPYRVLDEDLRGYFKNQYLNAMVQKMMQDNPQLKKPAAEKDAYKKALAIAKLDPTFKGRDIEDAEQAMNKDKGAYFDWLMRLIKKGGVSYEDMMGQAHEYTDQLNIFNDLKKRNRLPADKKDIMRFKNLHELMEFIQELGATADAEGNVQTSDFKNDIRDIRQGIATICRYQNPNNIPAEIQNVDDVMYLVGENNEWEVWAAKSVFATMIFDKWGAGAGWCVGGMLSSPRNGEEQYRAASSFYTNYAKANRGEKYVCFQRKDRNARRPDNKYLITMGPRGVRPTCSSGYQFNNASNSSVGGWDDDSTMEALASFLVKNNLVDVMRNSEFTELPALNIVDNMERLKNGEPYLYHGGKIGKSYIPLIKKITFTYDGHEYTVDIEDEDSSYFKASSPSEMYNLKRLEDGEPFIYTDDMHKIPDLFVNAIKEMKFKFGGTEYTVNLQTNPEYKQGASSEEMYNIKRLADGESYIYAGTQVPRYLREGVRKVEIDVAGFNDETKKRLRGLFSSKKIPDYAIGVDSNAFDGCSNLEEIKLPKEAIMFAYKALFGIPETAKVTIPADPQRPFFYAPMDINSLAKYLYYEDGRKVFNR